jgi:hypothetical protein
LIVTRRGAGQMLGNADRACGAQRLRIAHSSASPDSGLAARGFRLDSLACTNLGQRFRGRFGRFRHRRATHGPIMAISDTPRRSRPFRSSSPPVFLVESSRNRPQRHKPEGFLRLT